jgi:serine/threonine protein kinase
VTAAIKPVLSSHEILEELGHGGMGVVYKARERQTSRLVALKMMQRPDAASLARFKQEFRALQDVSHPNLVALYGAFLEEGQWFFTMELLEGTDFLSYVRGGALEEQTVATKPDLIVTADAVSPAQLTRLRSALRQLAEGLAALHAAGKVHRDIKPSNVLVTPEGLAWISTDNYLPKREGDFWHSGSGIGFVIGHSCYPARDHCLSLSSN